MLIIAPLNVLRVLHEIVACIPFFKYIGFSPSLCSQEELTSKDLFHAVYGKKILRDFKEGKLDEEGNPAEPSAEEGMTRDEAWVRQSPSNACQNE